MSVLTNMLLMAAPPGGEGGGGGFGSMIVVFGAMILIMYFFMIRPQVKRQKEHQKMIESIKRGDKVVTGSGIHGTVTDIDEKTTTLQIAENVKVRFEKAAISNKVDKV